MSFTATLPLILLPNHALVALLRLQSHVPTQSIAYCRDFLEENLTGKLKLGPMESLTRQSRSTSEYQKSSFRRLPGTDGGKGAERGMVTFLALHVHQTQSWRCAHGRTTHVTPRWSNCRLPTFAPVLHCINNGLNALSCLVSARFYPLTLALCSALHKPVRQWAVPNVAAHTPECAGHG